MNFKKYILFLFFPLSFLSQAQDNIILKNGDFIKGKVVEASNNETNYRKDSTSSVVYTIKNRDLRGIKYKAYDPKVVSQPLENYPDKIFFPFDDFIEVTIISVSDFLIKYRSKNADNNVTYILNRTDIKSYQFGNNNTFIEQKKESKNEENIPVFNSVDNPVITPIQPKANDNTQLTTTKYVATTTKSGSSNVWFINPKTSIFLPVGDFAKGSMLAYINNPSQSFGSTFGQAKVGASFAVEGAYFFGNYVGIVSEIGYTAIATEFGDNLTRIPIGVEVQNKGWDIFNFAQGIIIKTSKKSNFVDFKALIAANQVSSNGLYLNNRGDILDLKASNFGTLGFILGADYKIDLLENILFSFGLDYFYGVKAKFYHEAFLDSENNNGGRDIVEGTLPARNVSIQGVRLNLGLTFVFGK